ncbi:MAG TPA: hypothetical protein VHW02_11510 [Rhizomicrobium sp.]|jgi:hypothetical protein|nr:hypothetical protein [Rhizomicrobium sp.]
MSDLHDGLRRMATGSLFRGKGFSFAETIADLASMLYAVFIFCGLVLLCAGASSLPTQLMVEFQLGVIRAGGAFLILFGLFGLLVARGIRLLVEIARNTRPVVSGRANAPAESGSRAVK